MIRRLLGALAVAALLGGAPAGAVEVKQPNPKDMVETQGDHAGHESGGLPQLKTESYPSQVFWILISFALLYWLMSRKALPQVGAVIEGRRETINADLGFAEAQKTRAEEVRAALEKARADADAQSRTLLAQATDEVKAQIAQRHAELNAQLEDRTRDAEAQIATAKQQALVSVRDIASEIATAAAARVAGLQLPPSAAADAVAAVARERGNV